jgi:Lrp/AsnC family transcriptional regulator
MAEAGRRPKFASNSVFAQSSSTIDARDLKILGILQNNSETSLIDNAEQVHVSPSACSRRIAQLRASGHIRKSVAVLDCKLLGIPTTVFIVIRVAQHSTAWTERFRAALSDIPEITEAHRLTGNFDYLLKVVLPNVEHYDVVYKNLVSRIDMHDVSAYISMQTVKFDGAFPVQHAKVQS